MSKAKEVSENNSMEVFESMPVPKAVFRNAIPAMIAILFTIVYNLADTFFIGLTHDDFQVAAVSLCGPLFTIFTAVGTIFGMGGTSVISRSLGMDRKDYARKTCSFCLWAGLGCGIVLLAVYFIFMHPLLNILGASENTYAYAMQYLQMIAIAGPFAIIPSTFSNIIRCEGKSMQATIGMIGGNIINIILDPILISGFGMGTRGAGLATLISMVCATAYYIYYFVRKSNILTISPKEFSVKDRIVPNVLSIGIPACLGSLMISVSTVIVHSFMASYNDYALAAVGIALKILMIATMLAGGIGQGVQAILGYCVGSKKWQRFKDTLTFSMGFAFVFCLVLTVLCYVFTRQLSGLFLSDPESISYCVTFSRLMLWTSPIVGVFYVAQNTIQAMGAAVPALVLNLSRQGIVFIPIMLILWSVIGMNGLVIAQPIADILSTVLAFILLSATSNKLKRVEEKEAAAVPA